MDYTIFGKNDISRQRFLLYNFSVMAREFDHKLYTNAISCEMFGSPPQYDINNELTYLYVLLLYIDSEMGNDLKNGNTAPWYDKRYYIQKYSIEKVRKRFMCYGFDITAMLSLIGLNNEEAPSGIDYMYIEGHLTDVLAETFIIS